MKWPLKPWMAPRQTRLSRNLLLQIVGSGGQANAAAVNGSVCCHAKRSKVAGYSPRTVRQTEAG